MVERIFDLYFVQLTMDDRNEPVAALIPTLNEVNSIGSLLQRLSVQGFAEIVVADGGSTDGTQAVVARFCKARLVPSRVGRGVQLRSAVEASTSPIVVMVHADTTLPEHAVQLIRQTLGRPGVAAGSFRLTFEPSQPALAALAWFTRFDTRFTTFGDQCFFTRRATLARAGGVPPWPLLEDVGLRDRLRAQGAFVKCSAAVVTSARRFAQHGVMRQQLRNALILAGYSSGVPIDYLARFYRGK